MTVGESHCSNRSSTPGLTRPGIEKVGTIKYNLDNLDVSKVRSVEDENGIKWCKLDLVLNIRMGDEVGHLEPRIFYRGREVGKAELAISTT